MPLVDPRRRIVLLESYMRELMTTAFEQPFTDYALYREAVGRYQGLKTAVNELRKEVDDGDDDQV